MFAETPNELRAAFSMINTDWIQLLQKVKCDVLIQNSQLLVSAILHKSKY